MAEEKDGKICPGCCVPGDGVELESSGGNIYFCRRFRVTLRKTKGGGFAIVPPQLKKNPATTPLGRMAS